MGRLFNGVINHAGVGIVTLCDEKPTAMGRYTGWAKLHGVNQLVGIFSKGYADGAVDGCRIFFEHVVRGFEQTDGGKDGGFREGEHLKEVAVKGNQIFGNEGVSCLDVFIETEVKQGDDPVIAVEGNPETVANQDEEEIEEQLLVGEALPEPIPQETVFNGGKAPFDSAHSLG